MDTFVKVFHRENDGFVLVAAVACHVSTHEDLPLEYAFFRTQNIEGSWSKPRLVFDDHSGYHDHLVENRDFSTDVQVMAPLPVHNGKEYGHRSTMTGDHMEMDGLRFRVGSFGFDEIEVK